MKDLKVKMTILDENDEHLISSIMELKNIYTIKKLHHVDVITETLELLLEEIERRENT